MRRPLSLSRQSAGFTMVEILVVFMVMTVLLAMAAVITRSVNAAQKRSLTTARMAGVDAAMISFVQQMKRLPCPADGTLVSSHNSAGLEVRAGGVCTGTQANGVVPWRSLALTEAEATDGWDRRITYRLDAALALDNAMNLSWCDPAGTGGLAAGVCNPACTSTALGSCTPPAAYLSNKGLTVKNLAGTTLMDPAASPHTGAAYVLISHGETGGGGYLSSGVLAPSSTTDGTEELRNYASQPFVPVVTYYVDDTINDTAGNGHFDDVVLRPSILVVAGKAGLGPRSH